MKSVNDQFEEFQKQALKNLEPIQSMNSVAAVAFERIARKNYDLMGDLVDYAVAQAKVPSAESNMQDAYEKSVADTKAFAEKVNERAAEYVALAGELGEMVQSNAASAAAPAPAKAPAKAAAKKKASSKKTTAKAK